MRKLILALIISAFSFLPVFAPYTEYDSKEGVVRYYQEKLYELEILSINEKINNNNPFNIKYSKFRSWEGRDGISKNGFEIFTCTEYGIKAGFELLQDYFYKKNKQTIEDIINTYAPPFENETDLYIDYLSRNLKIDKKKIIPIRDIDFFINLGYYMIKIETGKEISREVLYTVYGKHFTT